MQIKNNKSFLKNNKSNHSISRNLFVNQIQTNYKCKKEIIKAILISHPISY